MLREGGYDGRVAVTQRPFHARELTRQLIEDGARTVVAWGGDGTINEVASALAFGDVTLGIVPHGSGNGLARELRLPFQPRRALEIALGGRGVWLDAGEIGDRLFFNVAGVGFDAHLAKLFNARTSRGLAGYVRSTLGQVFRYRSAHYELRADGNRLSQRAMMVVIANTRQYGNNAVIAPLARPDDGLLELVVVPALSPLRMLWEAHRLFVGSVHTLRGVTMRSVRQVEIAGEALPSFHVDGEVVPVSGSLSARVRPRALRVHVPD